MKQAGLILVANNADLVREEQAAALAEREAEERREELVESNLAAHIRKQWELAKRHKEPVQERMLDTLRQINGRYSDAKAAEIKAQGLPLIYMKLTAVKCRAAKSWIRDVLMPAGDRPWSLDATPVPSLPEEMKQHVQQRVQQDAVQFIKATGMQLTPQMIQMVQGQYEKTLLAEIQRKAEEAAARMADLIEDQLVEGNWDQTLDDVISDLVDFPAAIIKAPVIRRRKELKWSAGGNVEVAESIAPEVERVNPFNFYPLLGVVNPDDGDCIELHEYTRDNIYRLIGLPGYDEEAIRAVLREYSAGGLRDWARGTLKSQQTHARGETIGSMGEDELIDAVEYWGSVQGSILRQWGMDERIIDDPEKSYQVMAVLIGRHVICVRLNPDPLCRKPYGKACFENIPGSFWGNAVPDLIGDCQDSCNAAARALIANMGIASGPQVVVNTGSVPPGQDITNIYPWKIWQMDYTKTGSNTRPPVEFYQPNPMTEQLLKVFEFFSKLADEYSGIPAYSYGHGGSVGGAGRTASGLSMLMNAGSKAIKNVIKHVDTGIISRTIKRFYDHNMMFHPDPKVKGDCKVVARGAMSLVMKEQNQMRVQELLQQTANPIDLQIMGLDGRASLLRRAVQGVDVGADEAVPDAETLRQRMATQAMTQGQQGQQSLAPQEKPREANAAGQPMGGDQ